MANTIKLKRGSGSDPSASDLAVGEVAVRTDEGKLFTKKDDGTVAEISGGGGIDDGDKGDITVSNSGATFTIDNGVVNNARIASDAAIAGTKISPDFGSQLVQTTGTVLGSGITISNAQPKLTFIDTNHNSDFRLFIEGGVFQIEDTTNGNADRLTIASDGTVDVAGNLDVGAGLDVTGDITGTGDLTLTSTDDGSSAAPIIELYRNSASPADADYLGQLKFTGESDDGSKEVYAKMTGKIDDASSGTEDGLFEFALRKDGSNNIGARLTSTDLKLINGTGLEVAGATTMSGNLTISNTAPTLFLTDTNANSDYKILVENGSYHIVDVTNNATRIRVDASGNIDLKGNVDCEAGLDVTGNAAVSGSVTAPRISGSNGILEVKQEIGTSQTLTTGYNAIAVDPTIANGVTITVPSGAVWSIV